MKSKKRIPYDFVLEALDSLEPYTKPMFGCTAVYVDLKIVFVLREKQSEPSDNGIWLATTHEHHESLKKDFPSMRSISIFGKSPTAWQILPAASPDFEEAALKACDLVLAKDPRIGKLPGVKKPKETRHPRRKASARHSKT